MPVHVVRWNGSEWVERRVADTRDGFVFVDAPISSVPLAERVRQIPLPLPAGYETEVNLAAPQWIEALTPKLTKGFIITVDYGHARDLYYSPHRTTGTLQCYANHRVVPSPLTFPGEVDITAHVEWTTLAERAESCGLTISGFADQHHFITGLLAGGIGSEFEGAADPQSRRALHTLLHPSFLGITFQFLVLSKNVDAAVQLAGLRFGRDPRAELGFPQPGHPKAR